MVRTAVVLGSAPGALEELEPFGGLPIVAVNRAGVVYLGEIVGWGSLHPHALKSWLPQRAEAGGNACPVFSQGRLPEDWQFMTSKWPGSSGLFCTQWALLEAGFDRVILCGVHIDGQTRISIVGDVENAPVPYEHYQDGWRRAQRELGGRIRSCGGWTAELLGKPKKGWESRE